MRLFFAVTLERSLRESVWAAIEGSPLIDAPWRWIRPENYHLTLKFLGDTPEASIGPLEKAAAGAAADASPFSIALEGFGGFPDLKRPRVLFYTLSRGFEPLASLAGGLEERCAAAGFERERRPFRAHLTVARVKRRISAETARMLSDMPVLESTGQQVERFSLVRSTLLRSGAVYEELSAFDL